MAHRYQHLNLGLHNRGTTSNIFTYFSRDNFALSMLMIVVSAKSSVILSPLNLLAYSAALDLELPQEDILKVVFVILETVAIEVTSRKLNANVGVVLNPSSV